MARWVRMAGLAGAGTGAASFWSSAGGFLALVVCVVAVATVAAALCATHFRKEGKGRGALGCMEAPARCLSSFKSLPKPPGRSLLKTLSSKKHLLSKKWGRSEDEELNAYDHAAMEDGEDFLWQRNILMGERCQPLNFSGLIVYDHKGNPLPQLPPRSPKLNGLHTSQVK